MASAMQQKLRQLLSRRLASGHDAKPAAVAENAVQAWIRAASQLAPLIGMEAVRALYARCLVLARESYSWLPPADIASSLMKSLAELRSALESRTPSEAVDASTAFLVNMTDLLGTMIGESLTSHLLSAAWEHDLPGQTTQEVPK